MRGETRNHALVCMSKDHYFLRETRPNEISLRIYFNAQALPAMEKPKGAPNALIPVDIEYHGQLSEFPIKMEQVL